MILAGKREEMLNVLRVELTRREVTAEALLRGLEGCFGQGARDYDLVMSQTMQVQALHRLLEPLGQCLTYEVARQNAGLRAPDSVVVLVGIAFLRVPAPSQALHSPPMNDPSSYPCPIPLSLPDAVTLFAGDAAFAPLRGAYLCFVMIPIEERIGEWRFAGTADSPAAAIATFDAFLKAISLGQGGEDYSARSLLECGVMDLDFNSSWSYSDLPLDEIGEHQVILLAEGGAPYDDAGLAILEVPSLADSPFASRAPQTERPRTWDHDASSDQEEEDDE